MVAGLAAAYVGLQLFAAGLHYAQSLLFNRAAVGVVQQLRTDVMDAALRQPLSEFDTQPVGRVISRVTNDTEVIRDLYVTVVGNCPAQYRTGWARCWWRCSASTGEWRWWR